MVACNNYEISIPKEMENILTRPSLDKKALYKVLNNFRNDSLKYKAAVFLLSNLDNYSSYEGSTLSKYSQYFSLIRRDRDHGEYFIKSFDKMYGKPLNDAVNVSFLTKLNSDLIIQNIDYAFKVWNNNRDESKDFETFCKELLPYQIQNSRMQNREIVFTKLMETKELSGILNLSIVERYNRIKPYLDSPSWILSNRIGYLPHFNAEDLFDNKVGSCRELTDMHLYALRAVGIPSTIDYIIQWPFRQQGHSWNVIFNEQGEPIVFDGIDNPLVKNNYSYYIKKGKVYRITYENVKEGLFFKKYSGETIPVVFNDPHILDVSDLYFKPDTINIQLKDQIKDQHVYLCLFDADTSWVPVAWGEAHDRVATFKNVEANGIYLPARFNGKIIPENYPVFIDEKGKAVTLIPHHNEVYPTIELDSSRPSTPAEYLNDDLYGAMIQGANNEEFNKADTLYTFDKVSQFIPCWNEISFKNTEPYKYIRLVAIAPSTCRVGELKFYDNQNKQITGKVIGGNDLKLQENYSLAFDGNPLSTYSTKASTAWVGLEFATPQTIQKLIFSPPIGPNDAKINTSNKYKLYYWENNWTPIGGEGVFRNGRLIFRDVPKNCLYLVRNITNNSSGRIFRYENRKVIWY